MVTTVMLAQIAQEGLGWLMRGRDSGWLDQPEGQARLRLPAQQQQTQAESGLTRQLFDCPQVVLTARGTRSRVIIASHAAPTASPPVGVLRAGQVAELFDTCLPPEAFLPSDVPDLSFQRGGCESRLADEEQEQDADRWCSGTPWGQECWQILAQWMWNLRIELAQLAQPSELRTTQVAPALAASVAEPAIPEVGVSEATAPKQTGQWARAARPGLFAGQDFTPQVDGTLRCPAGQTLWERERRPQGDGSLRISYAARLSACRTCALRAQCLRREPTQTVGRKVSVVLGKPSLSPAPSSPAVTLSLVPAPPQAQSRARPTLSRAPRRLSWTQRLSRNASLAQTPRVRLHLCGMPAALAQVLGLAS